MKRITSYASLRDWRAAHALSQREAARALRISQSMYARAELGRGMRPKRGKAISERTGVPFEIIMGVA